MVDAPGFVIELGTDRSWRRLVRGTHALALAALAAWLVAHGRAGSLGLAHALAAVAVLLPVVAAGTRRQPPPARLQAGSTPGTWRLDGGPDGRVDVAVDLGDWMLLRHRAPAGRAAWLPLSRRDHAPSWHALRCAVFDRRDPPPPPRPQDRADE